MIQTLLKTDAYNGYFIAFRDFEHPAVITSGDNPQKVLEEAQKKGIIDPIITYVPLKGMVQIY